MVGGGHLKTDKTKEKKRRSSHPLLLVGKQILVSGCTILVHLPGPISLCNISQDPRAENAFPKLWRSPAVGAQAEM